MAKLPRVTAKIFASNAAANDIGQYGSALTGNKVTTGDIATIQALPAYETGWRGAVLSTRNYPTLQEMNGLQKTFSQQIAYLLESGVAEYDINTTYYQGDIIKIIDNGVPTLKYSVIDENTGNDTTDTAYWRDLGSSSTTNIDNITITENTNEEIQTVAVIDNRSGNAIKTWTGTRAQYDAIATKDANTIYNITDDTDVTLSLLELLYPVGAIYIGTMSTCPLSVLGIGTWVLKATDRVLQGSGTNNAGVTVEAGLPNITGTAGYFNSLANNEWSGALYNAGSTSTPDSNDGETTAYLTGLDASRSNPIYGNSTTVQPPAYIVNIWERVS